MDDNVALERNEAFTIRVGGSMAMVTIIDDDGGCYIYQRVVLANIIIFFQIPS